MNDQIYTLATRAWLTEQGSNRDPIIPREFIEKFAELIVKECAHVALMSNGNNLHVFTLIKEHFGVE